VDMTKETEALKLALEALENISTALREDDVLGSDIELMLNAITAIEEALTQPVQVSEYECRKLLYGFMLDCNAVGLEQAGKNLHRSMKEKNT
jgi:hypothetical protein